MSNPERMSQASRALEKLRAMVAEQGGPIAFSRAWSRNPNESPIDQTYVSQLLNGHRPFGERARINMARRCALPDDFFDCPSEPQPSNGGRASGVSEPHCPPWNDAASVTLAQIMKILRQLPVHAHIEALGAVRVIAAAHGVRTQASRLSDE
jgi:hypothetical protein